MSIENLKREITISQISADNENYLIRFTIADGEKVLEEIEQLQTKLKKTKEDSNWYEKKLRNCFCPNCEYNFSGV